MALGRSEETEVLRALYADASGTAGWQGFLAGLSQLTRAHAAGLILAEGGALHLWPWGKADAAALPRLCDPADPAGLHLMRADRVYTESPWPETCDLRAIRVAVEGGGTAWIVLLRLAAEFRAVDSAQLSALAPHLPLALAIHRRLSQDRARAARDAAMTHSLGLGWLVFDAAGGVSDHSPAAAALLASPGLRLDGRGRLRIADPFTERNLADALDRARATATPVTVDLARTPRLQLLLVPAAPMARPGKDAGDLLLGYLRGPDQARPPDAALVAQAFGLSRGEARLALALCAGSSLAEAATALGFTLETARNYSKRIYASTGTRGQGDLIRLLLNSAVWLAP